MRLLGGATFGSVQAVSASHRARLLQEIFSFSQLGGIANKELTPTRQNDRNYLYNQHFHKCSF
jgi:hypothetical protein